MHHLTTPAISVVKPWSTHGQTPVNTFVNACVLQRLCTQLALEFGKGTQPLLLPLVRGCLENLPHFWHIVHEHVFNAALECDGGGRAARARPLRHRGGYDVGLDIFKHIFPTHTHLARTGSSTRTPTYTCKPSLHTYTPAATTITITPAS